MDDAKACVCRVGFAVLRFGIGGAIGAGTQGFRGAVCADGPFADISPKIEDKFLVFFALARKGADLAKQRGIARQFFDFGFEFRSVLWI